MTKNRWKPERTFYLGPTSDTNDEISFAKQLDTEMLAKTEEAIYGLQKAFDLK